MYRQLAEILDEYRSMLISVAIIALIMVLSVQGMTLTKQALENRIGSGQQTYTWACSGS